MGQHGTSTSSSTQDGTDQASAAATEQNASADLAPEPIPMLPKPQGGSGSYELATDSSDPAILRQHLDRARERLTFYESFDRIIGENIRRSGELMLETITLREEAQERDRMVAELEAQRNTARAAEHHRTRTLLGGLLADSDRTLASIASLRARLADALAATAAVEDDQASVAPVGPAPDLAVDAFDHATLVPTSVERVEEFTPDVPARSAISMPFERISRVDTTGLEESVRSGNVASRSETLPTTPSDLQTDNTPADTDSHDDSHHDSHHDPLVADGGAVSPHLESAIPDAESDLARVEVEPEPSGGPAGSDAPAISAARSVDVLVHGIPRASVAISLQRYLKNLPGITTVETREFAEGVLRLGVVTSNPAGLALSDLSDWPESGDLTVLNEHDSVLELSLCGSVDL